MADLLLIAALVALFATARRPVDRFLDWSRRLARRRAACIAAAGVLPVLARLALLPVMPVPEPSVHDEFSYLLGADTFASGRLVNPPHPMSRHFETFHVELNPAYVSKYPPGQPAALALGQWIFGHPWAGVLISVGLMSAATCWMLYGWLRPGWALFATALAMSHYTLFTYWMDSYWGGAVPALAGALVLGAYPRLRRAPRLRDAVLLGLGLSLLVHSRPFEGLAVSAPVMLALILRFRRGLRPLVPAAIIVGCAIAFAGYYNYRSAGHPLRMAYSQHQARYGVAPLFVFGSLRDPPPHYTDERFRQLWAEWDVSIFHEARSSFADFMVWKLRLGGLFYLRDWPQWVLLATLPGLALIPRFRFPLLPAACLAAALMAEKSVVAHYAAPGASLFILLSAMCLFALTRAPARSRAFGMLAARVIASGWIALFAVQFFRPPAPQFADPEFQRERREVIGHLKEQPGNHLVLVHYSRLHNFHYEWIYNEADIDASRIVWARSLTPEEDRKLLEYFANRTAWRLDPDPPPGGEGFDLRRIEPPRSMADKERPRLGR
jgi:hypothetical protein